MITTRRAPLTALAFLAPSIVGFLVFVAAPVAVSLAMAFTNWNLSTGVKLRWVGMENFAELIGSQRFWVYFINTLYLMLGIPISIAGSLMLALLLNDMKFTHGIGGRLLHAIVILTTCAVIAGGMLVWDGQWARPVAAAILLLGIIYALGTLTGVVAFRTLYYLPSFTSGVALFILWKALYNPEFGPINAILQFVLDHGLNDILSLMNVGPLSPPEWLNSTKNLFGLSPEHVGTSAAQVGLGARHAIIIMGVVTTVGGNNMLLYLAGLSNIPPELYEAATIDGAGPWQTFWNVTWPQLAPTTFFIVVMSTIAGLQGGFEVARVMTQGGPAGTTTTLSYYIYELAFAKMELGYASAVAWFMCAIVFGLTLLIWKYGNRYVND